jgi:hypothetical protein
MKAHLPTLRTPTHEEINHVCANMRVDDRAAWFAVTPIPPEIGLPRIENTWGSSLIVAPSGEILGLCGVFDTTIEGTGFPWVVATNAIANYPCGLVHYGRIWVAALHTIYPRLVTRCDARNAHHLRLLKHLGFEPTGSEAVGAEGHTFITFERGSVVERQSEAPISGDKSAGLGEVVANV